MPLNILSIITLKESIAGININSKALKNEMVEVITKLTYKDPSSNKRKSHFEISYSTIIFLMKWLMNLLGDLRRY